jgi:feruloyl-CoA synthase
MGTGLGMTESGPFGIFVTNPFVQAGDLGVPTPGLELKLVDTQGKTEVRYRGPNITPGYWRNAEETAGAFDEEGFFKTGDAVQWIDDANVHLGLKFDGRIAEDFKLATGTFVSVGPLRGKIIAAGAPYIQDAVLTGINLKEVGAMIFPTPAVRTLSGLPADAPRLLIVAPMSGHYATLLRGTVERMLERSVVYITDWADAKYVPLAEGHFDLDEYIDYLIGYLEHIGPGAAGEHVDLISAHGLGCGAGG